MSYNASRRLKADEPCPECRHFGTKNDVKVIVSDFSPIYPTLEVWCAEGNCERLPERAKMLYNGRNYNGLPPELRQYIKPPEDNGRKQRLSLGLK